MNKDLMLTFGDSVYYIDFDNIDKLLTSDESLKAGKTTETIESTVKINDELEKTKTTIKSTPKGREVDLTRYEIFKGFLEVLLMNMEEGEEILGTHTALKDASLGFKISFNTLIH